MLCSGAEYLHVAILAFSASSRSVGRSVGSFQNQFRSAQVIFKSVAERHDLRGGRTVSTLSPMAGRNVCTCVCVRSLEGLGYTYVGIHTWYACRECVNVAANRNRAERLNDDRRCTEGTGSWLSFVG